MIERWLAEFDRHLRVHGRRRRRVIEELEAHLREGAAAHGEPEAVRRMGDARTVAESFTPGAADRLFEQRDRLAALLMLSAMAASLPLARTAAERQQLGDPRPALEELYRDRDDYVARARAAAIALAAAGYLLADDVDLATDLAAQRYDVLARQPVGAR